MQGRKQVDNGREFRLQNKGCGPERNDKNARKKKIELWGCTVKSVEVQIKYIMECYIMIENTAASKIIRKSPIKNSNKFFDVSIIWWWGEINYVRRKSTCNMQRNNFQLWVCTRTPNFMQKCNKLLNNIVVYLCSNCCLKKKKKLIPLHVCDSWHKQTRAITD